MYFKILKEKKELKIEEIEILLKKYKVEIKYKKNAKLPVKFKYVEGSFDCSCCDNLTSLQGAPEIVEGDFNCSSCENLESLQGAPELIKGNFKCLNCFNLRSLEGLNQVEGLIICKNNKLSLKEIKKLKSINIALGGKKYVF